MTRGRSDEPRCKTCGDQGVVPVDPEAARAWSRWRDPDGVDAPETTDCPDCT